MQTRNKKTSKPLYLLFIISILPVIIGSLLYYYRDHFEFKTLNRGTLINPPIQTQEFGMSNENKWKIVFFPANCCDQQCESTVYTLHQLRKLFNKDSKRITLILVANQTCNIKELHDFQKVLLNKEQYTQFKKSLKNIGEANKIYLVDPASNMFMYYPITTNPLDILKDLKRVLEVSQIG